MGGSFGGTAAADVSIASQPREINQLILLAAEGNGPAERIKAPLLIIVAREDANDEGLRLPRIRAWFDKAPQPKELIVLDGSAHAQFLFQTDQADRVMNEVLRFLAGTEPPLVKPDLVDRPWMARSGDSGQNWPMSEMGNYHQIMGTVVPPAIAEQREAGNVPSRKQGIQEPSLIEI
jgi:hypothetical protein